MAVQIPNFSFLAQPTVTQGFGQAQDTMGRMGANKAQQIQNQAMPARLQAQLQAQQLANQSRQQQNLVQPQSLQQGLQSQIYANQVAKAKGKYADPMAQAQLGVEEQRPGLMGAQTQLANIQAQQAPEKLQLQRTGNLASTMRQGNVFAQTPQAQALLADPKNKDLLKAYTQMGAQAIQTANQLGQDSSQQAPISLSQRMADPSEQQGIDPATGAPMQAPPEDQGQVTQDQPAASQEDQGFSDEGIESARQATADVLAKKKYTGDQLDRLSRANNLVTLLPDIKKYAEDAFTFSGQSGALEAMRQSKLPASMQSKKYENYLLFQQNFGNAIAEYQKLAGTPSTQEEAKYTRDLLNPISSNVGPDIARARLNQFGKNAIGFANSTAKGPSAQVADAASATYAPLSKPGQGQLGAAMSKNGADNYQAAPTGMVSMVAKNGEMHYVPSASVAAAKEKFGLREVS